MKILAIDIGSAQIKSVVLDAKFNRFDIIRNDILEVAQAPEANDASPPSLISDGQISALRRLREQYKSTTDRIVTSVPFNLYTSRLLTFPFSDRKKIIANSQFQIEDEVPFDLDKCVVSNQIFPSRNPPETNSLCGVASILELQGFLKILTDTTGFDPDVLTTIQSSTYSFLSRQPQIYANKGIAIINLGHRQSSINIYKDSIPVLNRTSMVGGLHLTQAIAQNYNISFAEAEVAKINNGFLAPPGIEQTNEQRMFSDLIAVVLEPVFHDFYQCLMAHFSRYHERVSQIYITGGTSLLPGTADYLAARWQLPVHPLKITSQLPNISIHPTASTESIISNAVMLGLSQVEGRSKDTQNFRIGALRRHGTGFDINFKTLEVPLKIFSIVYVVALVSLGLQYFLLKGQMTKKDLRLEAAIRRVFGNPKAGLLYTLKSNPEKTRRETQDKVKELKAQVTSSLEDPSFSVLSILKDMSESIPRSNIVEIRHMNITPDLLKMKIESPTQADLDGAIANIKKVNGVTSASEPLRETLPNQSKSASLELKLRRRVSNI